MRRGTTPTLTLRPTVRRGGEKQPLDLSGYERVVITFKSDCGELDVEGDRLVFDDSAIAITLTQEETLSFRGVAEVQIRAYNEGLAIASSIANVDFERILKEGVIE